MRVTGRVVEDNTAKLVRKVALAVDAELVLSTPVDTGRARSNWQAEINTPATGEAEPVPPQQAIDDATRVIAESKPGDAIHITNNLPYIGRLNEGWSAQAPEGFVETAILHGAAQVKGAKLTIEGGVK